MRKIRLKSHKKIKKSTKISIVILLIIIFSYLFIRCCGNKFLPVIMNQAKVDCKKMALVVIKNSLNDETLKTLEGELYNIVQNSSGEIQTIDFNPVKVNKFLDQVTDIIAENLRKLETGQINDISFIDYEEYNIENLKNGVISQIPMGIISNNVLLSNIGPKIPVKISLSGNVLSSIETNISNYGINNALLEITAKVEVTEEVILPFKTEKIKVVNNIPIAIKVINGSVPDYYSSGKLSESSNILSIPIESN